jgi:hypothetical protein
MHVAIKTLFCVCSKRESKIALVKANKENEDEQRRLKSVEPHSPAESAGEATPTASSNHERHDSYVFVCIYMRKNCSYDITPLRPIVPSSDSNYNIDDLDSGDETDDDEKPRKQVCVCRVREHAARTDPCMGTRLGTQISTHPPTPHGHKAAHS